jgi:hypothetical protein
MAGSFAPAPNGGLLVLPDATTIARRDLVVSLAARYRLPAVYPFRLFVAAGGLMSYGTDLIDQFRLSASYIDRILRGAKPADLPVQAPTKYETIVNLKAANDRAAWPARGGRRGDRMMRRREFITLLRTAANRTIHLNRLAARCGTITNARAAPRPSSAFRPGPSHAGHCRRP